MPDGQPIKYVLLTHYHAVRVLGASAYVAEGATEIIASQGTLELIRERGAQDMQSEMERFPRLFRNAESVPGRCGGADMEPRSVSHARRHHRLGRGRESAVLR